MKTVYLIHGSTGDYDEFSTFVVTGFFSEVKANLKMEELALRNEAELVHADVAREFQYAYLKDNPAPRPDTSGIRQFPKKPKKPVSTSSDEYKAWQKEHDEVREHNRIVSLAFVEVHHQWQKKLIEAREVYLREAGVPEWYIDKIKEHVHVDRTDVSYSVEALEIEDDPYP